MASVLLEDLHKTYPGGHEAVAGLDLAVADGERLVLVGPSGCGKSTVLRLIAGLEAPTRGRVRIDGDDVTGHSPRERDVAMVFQSYALYPHKSVRENLAFGLRVRAVDRTERERRVNDAADRLGLADVLDRRPGQLSGGQRQRVALGRALVREPRAFLLDEPLSNLDARLRVAMRGELARLFAELGATLIYVTHDQDEAMTLGDRVAVMNAGRIEQVGAPLEVYERPATVFVADFMGSPAMNWLEAESLPLPPLLAAPGRSLRIGVRPQDLRLVEPEKGTLCARVEVVEALGGTRIVHAALDSGVRVSVVEAGTAPSRRGERVGIEVPHERLHVFDAESGRRVNAEPDA